MIGICCDRIENKMYVLPDEKYSLYRALAYLIFMIDSEPGKNTFNAFKARKLPLNRVQKIIKSLPIVPQIADMTISLPSIIALSVNYDQDKMDASWGKNPTKPVADYYQLKSHWKTMRQKHSEFTCKLAYVADNCALDELLSDVKKERSIQAMKKKMVGNAFIIFLQLSY